VNDVERTEQRWFEEAWGEPLEDKRAFCDAFAESVAAGRSWAGAKIGGTENALALYPLLLERGLAGRRRLAYEQLLARLMLRHAGLFPTTREFTTEFADQLIDAMRSLDSVGLFDTSFPTQLEILRYLGTRPQLVLWTDQLPDRSVPADDSLCYLPSLRGRRLLLICPFAAALAQRANRATFEAVWRKIGKRWFEPARVEAVELPYGFAAGTRRRYGSCLELLDEVVDEVLAHEFDVAFVATGGLSILIAARLKAHGKVALTLGGYLQVVFGVLGARWRDDAGWQRRYFNEAWIDVPAQYRPDQTETDENYW
jgi:hypothetical protein